MNPKWQGPAETKWEANVWYQRTPKRRLAEIIMHMAAVDTGHYEDALDSGEWLAEAIRMGNSLRGER